MIEKIDNEAQYDNVVCSIEKLIAKATDAGGFSFLSAIEKKELAELSLLTEKYEDGVLKIMPLQVANISEP